MIIYSKWIPIIFWYLKVYRYRDIHVKYLYVWDGKVFKINLSPGTVLIRLFSKTIIR